MATEEEFDTIISTRSFISLIDESGSRRMITVSNFMYCIAMIYRAGSEGVGG